MSSKRVNIVSKLKDFSRNIHLLEEADKELLANTLDYLERKYESLGTVIPISGITSDITPQQYVVKYLKENLEWKTSEIAKLLDKSSATISMTYKSAGKGTIKASFSKNDIPISALGKNKSVFGDIVAYLIKQGLSYKEIGALLHRDEKTIYTIYRRLGL